MYAITRTTYIDTPTAVPSTQRSNLRFLAAAAALAVVLLVSLAPLPYAEAPSNQTWRVELAAAVFLLEALAFGNIQFALTSGLSKLIAAFFASFILWSLISAAWAMSFAAVAHHTLLWCEYALFFTLASEILKTRGRSFLLTAFILFIAVIGLVAILDYVTLPDFKSLEKTLRARYSAYGELVITILPLLWAAALYRLRTRSWLLGILPAALGWTAAMLSLSKGVFIAGIIGSLFAFAGAFIFGKKVHRKRLLATACVWLAVTVVVQAGFSIFSPIPATVDYISGKADQTRETSTARIFVWRTTVPLLREHWLVGVGADNYGLVANDGRAEFRKTHPTDPPDEPISDAMFARAHNEPLQVLLELGIPGLLLFAAPFLILVLAAIKLIIFEKRRPSLMFWAAAGGMVAFGVSSMLSSFSVRIVPNGIGFFLVFAFAVHELSRVTSKGWRIRSTVRVPKALVAGLLLIATLFFAVKGFAEYSFAVGDVTVDRSVAATYYSRAAFLDPDYAAAHYRLSGTDLQTGNFPDSIPEIRKAIRGGMGVVLMYASLADCYAKVGDRDGEFAAYDEALRIFPNSVFLRVRYSTELEKASAGEAAAKQLTIARNLDEKQANGWYSLITRGSVQSFYDARMSEHMDAPVDLKPDMAVGQYLDKFPGQ